MRRSAAASAAGDAPKSLRAAVEEAKSVKRKDREAQAIDRAVARVTRDMDRVDFSSDRRGALERREKVALGAATAVAAGATLTAAAPAAAVAAGAAATAAIGGYKEWGALRAAANAHEVSAVAVSAAAEAEEILAGAERVKSVLPVCVVLGATALAPQLVGARFTGTRRARDGRRADPRVLRRGAALGAASEIQHADHGGTGDAAVVCGSVRGRAESHTCLIGVPRGVHPRGVRGRGGGAGLEEKVRQGPSAREEALCYE